MRLKYFQTDVIHSLLNLPGWHTKKKIMAIVSDDWGSIRTPSLQVLEELRRYRGSESLSPYLKNDSLETKEDLQSLFEVLLSITDNNGNHPVITANTVMVNPDFDKIKSCDYKEYYYELFTDTYKKDTNRKDLLNFWKEGIDKNIFFPQFHGREHLNVFRWLAALQMGEEPMLTLFKFGMFDLSTENTSIVDSYMCNLNLSKNGELPFLQESLIDGLRIFREIFGFKSRTFIAPSYVWSEKVEQTLYEHGVFGIQSNWFQLIPSATSSKKRLKKRFHYTGQSNSFGQVYLVRNAHFEPCMRPNFDFRSDVLRRARIVFAVGKPLILSAHRLNFIGSISKKNQLENLKLLKHLLSDIKHQWPDIEFVNIAHLFALIQGNNTKYS